MSKLHLFFIELCNSTSHNPFIVNNKHKNKP